MIPGVGGKLRGDADGVAVNADGPAGMRGRPVRGRDAGARGDRQTRSVLLGLDLQGLGGRGLLAGLVDLDELELVGRVLLQALDGQLTLLVELTRGLGELAVAGADVDGELAAL